MSRISGHAPVITKRHNTSMHSDIKTRSSSQIYPSSHQEN